MNKVRKSTEYNLNVLLQQLVAEQAGVEEIYLFGSRAYGTGSMRSDCDLLVRPKIGKNVKSSDLRDFSITYCAALDFFLAEGGTARSCANDSYVYAESFEKLASRLDAVKLWSRTEGFCDFAFHESGSWSFKTAESANFAMTVLPDEYLVEQAWLEKIRDVEKAGLPARPYLGDTLGKATTFIQEVTRRMVFQQNQLGQKGQAKNGWTVNLQNEYDCQNLFYTVIKPWLPALGREEVAIYFDDQKKISDFSLFEGKLIIEMKFIDSAVSKAAVAKSLEGLGKFYSRNANVGILLIIIFVKSGKIDVDEARWEADFTHIHKAPSVITMVVKVP